MARPQLPGEAALKPHNFLIITISAAALGTNIRRGEALMEPGHCPCRALQSLQEMELKVLTPFGLPETPRAPASCL